MRTAECVSPMHPDKMCDRISDTLLDLHLRHDPLSRVAIETCGGNGLVYITGEVTSQYKVSQQEIEQVVQDVTKDDSIAVIINLNKQSPQIAQGVDVGGAGDQGIMIGYACSETDNLMPFEYEHARRLNKLIFQHFPYDGKTQVTINGFDVTAVASFQNAKAKDLEELIYQYFQDTEFKVTKTHCNPAGDWTIGGFTADAGLTGRKLAVDNYGPRVPIGGGAFSGKDATKVDRSAAYMARRIAVDAVQEKGLKYALVELSYAIGYNQPIQAAIKGNYDGINVETGLFFEQVDKERYDLSPGGIIKFLDLRNPIFSQTAEYGHMGAGFNWK
jgi:S-adenosylmethionine synthetase